MAKPFLKWAGGKRRLVWALMSHVSPASGGGTYAEPFLGGGAFFFGLEERANFDIQTHPSFREAILSDSNPDLIACYLAVRNHPEELICRLLEYSKIHSKETFLRVRAEHVPTFNNVVFAAARVIYLNKTCFNGLYRVNSKGKFNVPFGDYKDPDIVNEQGIRAASKALQCATLLHTDYLDVTSRLASGDFVYLDPPYVPVSRTASFTGYTSGGFGPKDQARLAEELGILRDRGVRAMLSNADTPETRELYKDFAIHFVQAGRAINSDGAKRGKVGELIVTNWTP